MEAQTGTGYVAAVTGNPQDWTPSWQVTLPAAVTADLMLGNSALFVPNGTDAGPLHGQPGTRCGPSS